MPDVTAAPLSDASFRDGPALSATSDMPVIDPNAATVEEPVAEVIEPVEEQVEQTAEEVEQEAEKKRTREDKRVPVGEVTKARAKAQEAEARATALAEQNAALAKSLEALTTKEIPADKPKRADFDDPDVYDAALDAWNDGRIETARKQAIADHTAAQQRQAAETRQLEMATTFAADVDRFKEDHPDFDEVFDDSVAVSRTMTLAIVECDAPAAVSYWLGQNKDDAARIAGLSDIQQVREIDKIAARLGQPEEKPAAKPKPAPIKPVGQRSGETGKDPNEMSTDEYAAHRNAQLREQRAFH